MYFFVDAQTQKIAAFHKLGDAARHALAVKGVEIPRDSDPVKQAYEVLGDSGALVNLSGAFESISCSDDKAAQELAEAFKSAVDSLHRKGRK